MLVSLHPILLQNCHKGSLGLFFFLHSQNIRHQHILEAWSQLQCSVHVSCSPWLHGPAKLAEKVRHGLSCVDERGGNDSEPPTQYIRLESLRGRQLCPCLLPAARHSFAWPQTHLKHGTRPYNWQQKGFLLLEICRGSHSACFGTPGKHLLAFTWKTSQRGPIPFTPELAACYLLLQHPSTRSWTNQGAGQFLAKESCLLIYTASVHEVHCIIMHSFYQKMPLLPSVQD